MPETGPVIASVEGLGRLLLRGDAVVAQAAGTAFGIPIPLEACRAEFHPPRAALWLGPDEFLLLLPEPWVADTMAALAAALGAAPHALVDVSQRQRGLVVEGADAATLLNAGCPLDLDLVAFPVNTCTRTLLGKAEVVLWRMAAGRFNAGRWPPAARSSAPCGRAAAGCGRPAGPGARRFAAG